MKMTFGGMEKFSTIDFPSCLCCVLFAAGCDLDCFYCHNRELLEKAPSPIEEEYILAFLKKRRNLLEGVTISGGEAARQSGLFDLCVKIKEMGYKIKLDTNGSSPKVLARLLENGLLDYVALDVKATPEDYKMVCGKDIFRDVAESFSCLKASSIDFETRTTLYPGLCIETLMDILASLETSPLWRLNYFIMPKTFRKEDEKRLNQRALAKKELEENKKELLAIQKNLIY